MTGQLPLVAEMIKTLAMAAKAVADNLVAVIQVVLTGFNNTPCGWGNGGIGCLEQTTCYPYSLEVGKDRGKSCLQLVPDIDTTRDQA